MPVLASTAESSAMSSRTRAWWLLLAGIAAAQLFAFWLVCSHQVRLAEARRDEAAMQQMVLSDCLQYIPGSTIASCTTQVGGSVAQAASAQADRRAVAGAMPVNFSYR